MSELGRRRRSERFDAGNSEENVGMDGHQNSSEVCRCGGRWPWPVAEREISDTDDREKKERTCMCMLQNCPSIFVVIQNCPQSNE